MCDTSRAPQKPQNALAELINRELDVTVDAAALRLFIRANWGEVTTLAHAIHGKRAAPFDSPPYRQGSGY